MVYVWAAVIVGAVGLTVLTWFALRLFKVVKAFGHEVARVSAELNTATAGLERAAGPAPPREPRPKPEP